MSDQRILFVTPQPFFLERGSPYRVRAEVQALVAQGYTVDLLSYPFGRDTEMEGVTQYRSWGVPGINSVPIGWSGKKLLLDIMLFLGMFVLLLRQRYRAIHGVEDAGVMAAFFSIIFRIPYVFDMHSQMTEQLSQCVVRPGGFLHRVLSAGEKWCMRRAAGIITVSDTITARVRMIAPQVPAMTLEDLALSCTDSVCPERLANLRSRFEAEKYQLLVYTGNFEPYQGIDLLLSGYAELINQLRSGVLKVAKHPRLIMVGGGNSGDERYDVYVQQARSLGLETEIVFVGQQSESDIGVYTELGDFLLSPRLAGAHTPLKIYTYMAAEKPIFATRIAAHTNVLHNQNAFLAEPLAVPFALALHAALDCSPACMEQRSARVREAKGLLERRFSRREFQRRMGVLYRAALGEYLSDEVLLSPESLELRQRNEIWG